MENKGPEFIAKTMQDLFNENQDLKNENEKLKDIIYNSINKNHKFDTKIYLIVTITALLLSVISLNGTILSLLIYLVALKIMEV